MSNNKQLGAFTGIKIIVASLLLFVAKQSRVVGLLFSLRRIYFEIFFYESGLIGLGQRFVLIAVNDLFLFSRPDYLPIQKNRRILQL